MAKAFRRADRAAAKGARPTSSSIKPCCACSGARRSTRRCGSSRRRPRTRRRAELQRRARVLRLQAAVHEGASLLRFAVRVVRRLQLCEARADRGSRRSLRDRHGRAREDRLPGGVEAAAGRRARDRHDALSRRRRKPLCERSRTSASSARACRSIGLDLRHTPSVDLFTRYLARAAAAARLRAQQRVPDGASARRIFSSSARGRGRSVCGAASGLARACSRSTTSFVARWARRRAQRARELLPARSLRAGRGRRAQRALSQRRYLDDDYRAGEALFPANRYDEDLQQVDSARDRTVGGCGCTKSTRRSCSRCIS